MPSHASRVLITGASRGLGLEFARQWLAEGHQVIALARNPDASPGLRQLQAEHDQNLQVFACDVADDEAVGRTAVAVRSQSAALDLVVNNAGRFQERRGTVDNMDFDNALRTFNVNALGPLRVSRAFIPLLRRGFEPKLVHITSLMGSIADNRSGGAYAYRMSKAALNMASRNLAIELQEYGIPSVVLHPGWVQTEMGGPSATLSVEESVRGLRQVIAGLKPEDSGRFLNWKGEECPW